MGKQTTRKKCILVSLFFTRQVFCHHMLPVDVTGRGENIEAKNGYHADRIMDFLPYLRVWANDVTQHSSLLTIVRDSEISYLSTPAPFWDIFEETLFTFFSTKSARLCSKTRTFITTTVFIHRSLLHNSNSSSSNTSQREGEIQPECVRAPNFTLSLPGNNWGEDSALTREMEGRKARSNPEREREREREKKVLSVVTVRNRRERLFFQTSLFL